MKVKIVQSESPVLLVGGGECDDAWLQAALQAVSHVVAADGGAEHLVAMGVVPDAVIGDMDSLSDALRASLPGHLVHPVTEQDSTDFDKCLRHISAPLILGYGFLGARVDHQMAAMTVLVRRAAQRCVLVGQHDVICCCPPVIALDRLPPGTRVSLFPMAEVTGRSAGLRWPIDGLRFAPAGITGTSNVSVGPVRLEVDRPGMLLILPVECRDDLIEALAAAPRWPPDGA